MNVTGKVALVTGGASGLGAATARTLAEAGAQVAVLDRQPAPDAAMSLIADVSDAGQVEAAIRDLLARFGRLEIAVSCAGVVQAARMLGKEGPMALDAFDRVIRVNLIGTFNVARLAAAAMAANSPDEGGERGVIINTASIAAFDGQIGQCAYAASKGGVASLTLPMARELARIGIRVMAIAPGLFDTPLLGGLPEAAREALAAGIPFPARLGDPAQFAQLVWHIVENSYLNGEVIRLDAALRMPPK